MNEQLWGVSGNCGLTTISGGVIQCHHNLCILCETNLPPILSRCSHGRRLRNAGGTPRNLLLLARALKCCSAVKEVGFLAQQAEPQATWEQGDRFPPIHLPPQPSQIANRRWGATNLCCTFLGFQTLQSEQTCRKASGSDHSSTAFKIPGSKNRCVLLSLNFKSDLWLLSTLTSLVLCKKSCVILERFVLFERDLEVKEMILVTAPISSVVHWTRSANWIVNKSFCWTNSKKINSLKWIMILLRTTDWLV